MLMKKDKKPVFNLGNSILTNIDLARVLREARQVDDFFLQNELRAKGKPSKMLKTTRIIEDLATENDLSILEPAHRKLLIKQLEIISEHAPVVHFSFPTEPSRHALSSISRWLRQNINHYALVQVGLEPQIGIGCVVRTDNKIFDCSLKNRLKDKKSILKDSLKQFSTVTASSDTAQAQPEQNNQEQK